MSRNRTDEPGLDKIVQQCWSIGADGIQKEREQVYTKQEEQFFDILRNSINKNGKRYEIKLPWKLEIKLENNALENINKPGKVRRFANAASKFRGQLPNSNLLTGPHILNNLLVVLMRFREHPVAVLADIEGMFMQIAIHQIDQSALHSSG